MAKERVNREVKTHLKMIAIYDKFAKEFEKKHGLELTYTEVTKKISEKILSVGGVKV